MNINLLGKEHFGPSIYIHSSSRNMIFNISNIFIKDISIIERGQIHNLAKYQISWTNIKYLHLPINTLESIPARHQMYCRVLNLQVLAINELFCRVALFHPSINPTRFAFCGNAQSGVMMTASVNFKCQSLCEILTTKLKLSPKAVHNMHHIKNDQQATEGPKEESAKKKIWKWNSETLRKKAS